MYRLSTAKRSLAALLLLGLITIPALGLWYTKGLWFTQNGSVPTPLPTFSQIAYGVNVDMTAIIPGTPYTIRTASGGNFFDLAERLGINTLRITDVQWESTGQEYSRASWDYVFDEANQHHMRIVLLLIGGARPGQTAIQQAQRLLGQYGLASAPDLWLVDLNNEPDLSNPHLMAMLCQERAYVKQVAPAVPITIGGWKSELANRPGQFDWQDPADIPRLLGLVDIVSPHLYEFEQEASQGFTPQQWTQRFLGEVRQQAGHKPILLEEFGASNGLAPTQQPVATTASPGWQDFVYQSVLQEVRAEHDQGVLGAIAWIISPRPAWPGDPQGNMTGWAFVLNNGQHLLPAAQEFRNVGQSQQRAAPS